MQKGFVRLFLGREGISGIFLRVSMIVFFMLIAVSAVSAEDPLKPVVPGSDSEASELQQVTVSGTVTDQSGEPVIGVSVVIKGTTIGTLTDVSGRYTIPNVPPNSTLSFTFIGMTPQEIALSGRTRIDVVMQELVTALEEVVVIGYGTQKKESVVGAISQTTAEQLQRTGNVTDFKQALTGQLPGVVTLTASGEPGGTGRGYSATNIFIRGMNTWNGGQPLILVDGVERSMDNLDVNEVENISILKDASATAVFGVKGANGVILINTKRGSSGTGKPKLSFTYNATAKMLSKLPEMMESYSAIMIRNEAIEREVVLSEPSWLDYIPGEIALRYKKPQTPEYTEIYPNVDWEEAMFRNVGITHRAALDIRGGTKVVSYFGSLAYLNEGDMFKKYDNHKGYDPSFAFNRFNFRSNLDFKVTSTTTLKVNLSGYYSLKNTNYSNEGSTSGADAWMWNGVYTMPPDLYLPQYSDGRWGWSSWSTKVNPVAAVYNLGVRQTRTTELNSDYHLEQNLDFIMKGLSAKASLYYDNQIRSQGGLYDAANHIRASEGNTPEKTIDASRYTGPDQDPSEYTIDWPITGPNQFDWNYNPWYINGEVIGAALWESTIPVVRRMMYQFQLNYARKFGRHNVTAMGLMKREEYARGSMFKNYREDWVFRTTYDFNTRYFFEFNGAYNGSEQFGPGYRFEFFPSVAVGWNVANEKFWTIEQVNRLKIRYSVGMVGDDNISGGDRWLYSSQLAYGGSGRLTQQTNTLSPYTWYRESVVGNPDIHWEKARKNNIGVEMGLFKDLFSITFDYFTEYRSDILLEGGSRSIPPFFGTTPPGSNVGEVKSHGEELEVRFDKRTNTGWRFWTNVSLARNINKIINRDDPALLDAHQKRAGFAIGQTKTTVRTGFYNNWDEIYGSVPMETNDASKIPGYYNILDFNADGVIKGSDDGVPWGFSEIPQNTANIQSGLGYKGLSVMIQLYGVNNASRSFGMDNLPSSTDVVFAHVADHWSEDNLNATSFLPRWKTAGEVYGDYYIFDASFWRLKTAEIAYTFNNQWMRQAGLASLKFFLNGNNLLFWSDLPDDREVAWSGGSASSGAYPTVKRINFGIDVTF